MSKAGAKSKKSRVRPLPTHRSFKLTKQKMKQLQPVPSAWTLLKNSAKLIASNKKIFLGIALIHSIFTFVFIQGFGSNFELVQVKQNLESVLGNETSQAMSSLALFGYLTSSAGVSTTDGTAAYQVLMTFIVSLAVIWAARQVSAGEKPDLRDTFYKGMYPLIPFVLLIVVISLEFIPFAIGSIVYSTVIQNGLAVTGIEKVLWLLLFILTALLTLYMVISSIFSLYIATLPEVRPVAALRTARELVLHRRIAITLRFIALPAAILLVYLVLFIPLIMFVTPIAEPLFLISVSVLIVYFHVYMYTFYRSLL